MELYVDTKSLNVIAGRLKQEISQYEILIDKFYKELDSVYLYWSGNRYQSFMEDVIKNRASIEKSYLNFYEYFSLIKEASENYNGLSCGVHYE